MSSRVRRGFAYARPAGLASLKQSSGARLLSRTASLRVFRSTVWKYWKKNGRHELPWRKTRDPYRILVSEVMLQQTQVDRVVPKYREFLKRFPTTRALAHAPLADVLRAWSGLGYNRRAKYLHDAAKHIVREHAGRFPRDYASLRAIPGIGTYTANAVRVFAFNEPEVLVETNVRTAIIHHFFPKKRVVEEYDIEKMAAASAAEQGPREWHSALFDYGAYLKRGGVRLNARSARYVKHSTFEGSPRQIRGRILRDLMHEKTIGKGRKWRTALASLARDGLIIEREGRWRIA